MTNRWWPTPDSALYLGLARSIYQGQGYHFNGQFSVSVTPGLPLLLAAIQALLTEQIWLCNLLMTICGLAALLMIYKVFSLLDSPRLAFWVVAATAASYTFYLYSHRVLTDAPFALLFWTMIYTAMRFLRSSRWWLVPTALLAIMCICIRAPGLLLIGPAALALAFERTSNATRSKRFTLAGVIILAVVVSAAAFYIWARLAVEHQPLYAKHLLHQMDANWAHHLKSFAQSFLAMPITLARLLFSQRGLVFREMGFAAMLLALVGSVVLFRRRRGFISVLVIVYPLAMIILVGPVTGLRERYYMSVHPLLVYAVIQGLSWSIAKLRRWPANPPSKTLVLRTAKIIVIFFIACNAPRLARDAFYYAYLSHGPNFYNVIDSGRYAELFDLAHIIQTSPPTTRVGIVGKDVRILHFQSHRRVVDLYHLRPELLNKPSTLSDVVDSHPDLQVIVFEIKGKGPNFLQRLETAANSANMTAIFSDKHFLAWHRDTSPKLPDPTSSRGQAK